MEIKFNIEKINKKDNTIQSQRKRIETSKKLAWFSGVCFMISLVYSIGIFTYSVLKDISCDFTMLITLITVTGATFAIVMTMYANKARYENVVKIKQSYLREKYTILKEIGALDCDRAVSEIEEEFSEIEEDADNEADLANQEITYNG